MSERAELLRAVTAARSGPEVTKAVADLDAFDRRTAAGIAQDRELDLAAQVVTARFTPVPLHEHHTAATDWLAELDEAPGDYRTAMIAEASAFVRGLPPAVLADAEEFTEQAHGRARTVASAYGLQAREARREFLSFTAYLAGQLKAQGASGLPQIDQTVDPNNAPSPTPYPTEVFDNFAPEQNDYNGGVESPDHASQIGSEQAPMLQQLQQMNSGGSGFGSGAELEDHHDTAFNPGMGYAEVPLGTPGQIPTAPGGQPAQATSAPTPIQGQEQAADAGHTQTVDDENRRQAAYTAPDPSGFRWIARAADVLHPYHEKCGANHWPDEGCGHEAHTASVAVGYSMNLDEARRLAQCELAGAQEGRRAIQAAGSLKALAEHHNRLTAAWADSERTAEDTAVLHGFMAVVRPVLVTGNREDGDAGSRLDFKQRPGRHAREAGHATDDSDPDPDRCESCGHPLDGNCGCGCCSGGGAHKEAASQLPQIQQTVDPNNAPTPEADDLPAGVMFPLNPAFTGEWETGPAGAQPKGTKTANMKLPSGAARMFGNLDAMEGKPARHKDEFASHFSVPAHGKYLRSWNNTAGMMHARLGRDPVRKQAYGDMTGRPDLYPHYLTAYATAWADANPGKDNPNWEHGEDASRMPAHGVRKHADYMTRPHQTTDDFTPPFAGPGTSPEPFSSNAEPQDADYQAGLRDGKSDAAAGTRPTFADAGGSASPYVKGYSAGYGGGEQPFGPNPDSPHSMGGDSGQAFNQGQAQTQFQVAKASLQSQARDFSQAERDADADKGDALPGGKLPIESADDLKNAEHLKGRVKGVPKDEVNSYMKRKEHEFGKTSLRTSAAFVPDRAVGKPDFRKGYGYGRNWKPGTRLVSQGSAAFEAGLYAGMTDNSPEHQAAFVAAHRKQAAKVPALGQRMTAHRAFTLKYAARKDDATVAGLYLTAGTTVDLVTDGPGTSPDPMGSTPINGPGTPPPSGGRGDPARAGGSPPYQGAPPLSGGPVVKDDVAGKAQEPPQPEGPLAQGFSGPGEGYGNQNLAPRAPNAADQPGYENTDAYEGDPQRYKTAAFRQAVQAGLQRMREAS